MSIVWGVHHAIRTVVATASGELRLADLEHYLDGLAAAATLSYRKVFDLTHGRLALSRDEMLALGDRIRGLESMEPMEKWPSSPSPTRPTSRRACSRRWSSRTGP